MSRGLVKNVIVAGLYWKGGGSSAHTHFVSTCASSAHTDLTHARTQSIGETQVRTQALSRMFAHVFAKFRVSAYLRSDRATSIIQNL